MFVVRVDLLKQNCLPANPNGLANGPELEGHDPPATGRIEGRESPACQRDTRGGPLSEIRGYHTERPRRYVPVRTYDRRCSSHHPITAILQEWRMQVSSDLTHGTGRRVPNRRGVE